MNEQIKKRNLGLVIAIYLLGIFMGALDTGIVTPARTIIQNNLGADEKTGIWMITIYTLAYAASIPIMGKLADKFGRKYVYLTSILLFGVGSFLCGFSHNVGNFGFLLFSRVIQAIGGGGIIPIATAEFGTSFPKEKRGMALGLIGGVFGIANIFGSSAGSAILDIFGKQNWQYIFYVNLPITLFIVIAGFVFLENTRVENVKKIDFLGIALLTMMVLSLLYGLKNIDFFHFVNTIKSINVYPFLIAFVVLLPLFIFAEKKAEDPVMNLRFFTNRSILITLIISFIVGIVMMGMIFVPQFSENALKIASGSGGYFTIVLSIFAGLGAPLSGRLIDKFGAKIILGIGFLFAIAGSLFLVLVATRYPNLLTVVISLIFIGIGMGFTIGTPLNYMMLENTSKEESNSALATLSLVRSIGTAIAPAIMIGFLANAGLSIQANVQNILPKEISVPPLPYAQELNEKITTLKADPSMKDKLANVNLPDLTAMTKININANGNSSFQVPADMVELMKSSDVTTITKNSETFASRMFAQTSPKLIGNIQDGVQKGITALEGSITAIDNNISIIGASNMGAVMGIKAAKADITDTVNRMKILKNAVPSTFETAKNNYIAEIGAKKIEIEKTFQKTLNVGFSQVYLTAAIAAILALFILMFYKKAKEE
jgi:EmrB/QacA subfamily drug resistance transporter